MMALLNQNIMIKQNNNLLKQELILKMKKFGLFPLEADILMEVMDK